jgi:hypothetical protein
MIDRQMASPMPRPSGFVVKKGWNMRSVLGQSSRPRDEHRPGSASTRTGQLPGLPLLLSWLDGVHNQVQSRCGDAHDQPAPAACSVPRRHRARGPPRASASAPSVIDVGPINCGPDFLAAPQTADHLSGAHVSG